MQLVVVLSDQDAIFISSNISQFFRCILDSAALFPCSTGDYFFGGAGFLSINGVRLFGCCEKMLGDGRCINYRLRRTRDETTLVARGEEAPSRGRITRHYGFYFISIAHSSKWARTLTVLPACRPLAVNLSTTTAVSSPARVASTQYLVFREPSFCRSAVPSPLAINFVASGSLCFLPFLP